MALSSDLISQFVKLTNDDKEDKPSNTVYGTVVEYEGEKYVRIDGSERLTRASQITDTKVNDRVIVTIENHTATVTGNISSPSASSNRVEELGGTVEKVGILLAGKIDADRVVADWAQIDELITEEAITKNLTVSKRLDAAEAVIVKLDSTYATIKNLEANYATIKNLEANYATIAKLETNYATIAKLDAEYVKSSYLTANYVSIGELAVIDGRIGFLESDVSDINTLIFGSATGDVIHTNFANAVIAQLGDAQIKSAMIKDLTGHTITASQITSGDIITDNVNVKSQDGGLHIFGSIIQVKDKDSNVRVQIGKDASDNYSFSILDASGNALFYEDGITANGIPDKIIVNDMVDDNANISASKLDINSLFDAINKDGSHTIKSTKVYLDEEGQTLSAKFQSITTKIDGISVGGRNLLLNTGRDGAIRLNTVDAARYLPTVKPTNTGGLLTLDCSTDYLTKPEEIYYRFMAPIMPDDGDDMYGLEPGQTYTLSGKAKVSTTSGTLTRVVARTEDRVGGWGNHDVKTTITETDSEEWIPFASAFTIQENAKNCYTSIQVYYEGSWTGVIQLKDLKFEKGSLATDWTPAPEDVDAVTTDLSAKYRDLIIDIDEFKSDIVENSQNIGTLTTNYSTLEQTIKGLSAAVGSYTSTMETLSSQVTRFDMSLEEITTRVSKTETDISNISDEGRNLLVNTGQNGTIKLNVASDVEVSNINYLNNNGLLMLNGYAMVDFVSGEKPEVYYCFMPRVTTRENMYGLKKGGTYTFSGKLRVSSYEGFLTSVKARFQDFIDIWGNDTDTIITQTDSSEWISFKHTFTIRENATCCCISIQLYYVDDMWSGRIDLKDLKLEKGDKATAWTPAPEDGIYGAIESSAETLTKQTETLLGSYAKKTELPTMSNYYTRSQTLTAIEQKASSITSTVSSTYSTKVETKEEIAALGDETKAEIAALEVGGRNLLLNTGGGEPIVMSNGATKAMSGVTSVTNVNGVQTLNVLAADQEIYYRFMQPTFTNLWGIEPGQTYTFSGKVKMTTIGGAFGRLSVRTQRSGGAAWSGGHSSVILTSDSDEWVEFVSTFTVESDAVGYYISLQVYYSSATNDATEGHWNGVIQLKELKLEKGDKATDWTPAPEDITTEFGNVRSEIKQLADSISLSVTGTLGQSASIVLSANGTNTTQTIDLSGVRTAFVNDPTDIAISAGTITFNSNTLLINSSNFTLNSDGNITASGGTIGSMTLWSDGIYTGYHNNSTYKNSCCGLLKYSNTTGGGISIFAGSSKRTGADAKFYVKYTGELYAASADISGTVTTTDGTRKAILDGDGLSLYCNDVLCGTLTSESYPGGDKGEMSMVIPQNRSLYFGKRSDSGGVNVLYCMFARPTNVPFQIDSYLTYENHFIASSWFYDYTYFEQVATHDNWLYITNQNGIGWYDSDGDQEHMIHMDSNDTLYVGSTSYNTKIRGKDMFFETKSNGAILMTGDKTVRIKSTREQVILQSGSDENDYALIFDGTQYTTERVFAPSKNGSFLLGDANHRWKKLYASSTCDTSDIRLKKDIVGLSDEHSELFDRLEPVQFKFIDDDDNRLRYGFIAQQVASAMAELGIDEDDLAMVQHDHWVDRDTGEFCEQYSMVYNEFIAMLVHEVQKLKREIKTLKGE